MKENDVQKVYWAAYEDGEVMESDDGILLISFDKETVEHYPSLPNQVLQVMICRPTASRPVDAALKSPPEIEGEYTLEGNSAAFVYVCQDGKKIATVYGSGEEKLERGYTIINALNAALKSPPECIEGLDEAINAKYLCSDRASLNKLLEAARRYLKGCADAEISVEDVKEWADGIYAGFGTEYASRITEEEAAISEAIRKATPRPYSCPLGIVDTELDCEPTPEKTRRYAAGPFPPTGENGLAALPHCPDGFVCVPRVPNQKMCQAGYETLGWKDGSCMYEHIWNAMIAAAEGNK